jgi:catechol 2,3-dioxygenase-like lactoylglutathione lyase family enzyme
MKTATIDLKKITANLIVDSIEDCLGFWVDRLGFEKSLEVPHEAGLGFVILKLGGVELMLQSRASLAGDVAALAPGVHRSVLYLDVSNLDSIEKALAGWPLVVPRRKTFYGADELIVLDPAGNAIFFAAH